MGKRLVKMVFLMKFWVKDFLLPRLHALLLQCWWKRKIPHKMQDTKIVTLYKNEGDYYMGISLLSVAGKTFARVLLKRLQRLADCILPETQSGFRACRSTTNMVFTLCQLQENAGTKKTTGHHVCWSDEGLWYCEQEISLLGIGKNRLPTYSVAVDHFFSQGHECVHSFRWKYISLSR